MDPEKQKQIVGYFIDESKEHLNTIEQGLLDLQAMLADSEMVNEVFRAAHSIKGGAAMLGFTSVQLTAHKLEDYFKILRENKNIKTDQNLQTLFLRGFDRLQELIDQLQSPFGLTKDVADEILAESEPIFNELKTYLHHLVSERTAVTAVSQAAKPRAVAEPAIKSVPLTKVSDDTRASFLIFQSDIPTKLRDMLQIFKQPDRPTSRQNLQSICDQMYQVGEQFELKKWCEVVRAVKTVVGSQNNAFRVLAPIVIKEIKQAQEMVLARRGAEIAISAQLRNLMPPDFSTSQVSVDDDISSIFGAVVESGNRASQEWIAFGDRLGWRRNNTWIGTASVNFSNDAPIGHLPAPIWLSAWDKFKDSNADELRQQFSAFVNKVSECETK